VVRGVREEHFDDGRVACCGKAKELPDLVEDTLRSGFELVWVVDEAHERGWAGYEVRTWDRQPSAICIGESDVAAAR
jgi:hypothetical protein